MKDAMEKGTVCMSNMKQIMKEFHQTDNVKEKEKIKEKSLKMMYENIESILNTEYSLCDASYKSDLIAEGYMAVLQTLETLSPNLDEEEIVHQMEEKIKENMRACIEYIGKEKK